MTGSLYITATPIGNCGDITQRARQTLEEADIIAAEDTRVSQKLLSTLGIRNKIVSNHKFNEKRQTGYLISELLNGKNIALVTDAGTPCIQDPGGLLVEAAAQEGIPVICVCGASAITAALSVCGFNFNSYAFRGFFPRNASDILKSVENCRKSGIDVNVFFESPMRVLKSIDILCEVAPASKLCLCNDLTKLHERIYRGTPQDVHESLINNPNATKGEYVLVIALEKDTKRTANAPDERITAEALIIDFAVKNGTTLKEAVTSLSKIHKGGITKKEFYSASVRLKELFGFNNNANE